ncbi:quinol oxidase subunit 4 [Sphingobacterium lactis]|uniref:quinol oxidase subunit 4 n=1 Tax=Sphingobacterium lactis TaxID=797291 RepID=UPI003F7F6B96
MKRFLGLLLIAIMAFSVSSCYVHDHRHGHLPPGQAKKRYGGKSAKRYAPGQQKKHHKANNGKGNKNHRQDVFWDQLRR